MRAVADVAAIATVALSILAALRIQALPASGATVTWVWVLLPVAASTTLLWSTHWRRPLFAWASAGVIWGVVVLGAWSVGTYYALAGTMGVVAAIVLSSQTSRSVAAAPVWFLLGATALCAGDLVYSKLVSSTSVTATSTSIEQITISPVDYYGSLVFAALAGLMGALRLFATYRTSRTLVR
jgi:hypothetical protein